MEPKSNALARAAAEKVATAPGSAYNPLYVHAAVGLGKTHLIQAVAHAAASRGRRVVYLTADGFMYGFVAALKSHNALAFKERLRGIDLLVIDDVQFLQGKSIQHEFCHTLNALLDAGKQIVVASHCAASDLENLDERTRSRLGGGLAVEMELPETAGVAGLFAKALDDHYKIDAKALEFWWVHVEAEDEHGKNARDALEICGQTIEQQALIRRAFRLSVLAHRGMREGYDRFLN